MVKVFHPEGGPFYQSLEVLIGPDRLARNLKGLEALGKKVWEQGGREGGWEALECGRHIFCGFFFVLKKSAAPPTPPLQGPPVLPLARILML